MHVVKSEPEHRTKDNPALLLPCNNLQDYLSVTFRPPCRDRGGVHGTPLRRTHRIGCFAPPYRGRGGVSRTSLKRMHRLGGPVAGLADGRCQLCSPLQKASRSKPHVTSIVGNSGESGRYPAYPSPRHHLNPTCSRRLPRTLPIFRRQGVIRLGSYRWRRPHALLGDISRD